ncbi:MAG: pyruvate kinase [Methylacidiphilales bacterium]|nr:pyruvate kinase [Candidatus Methylacidiphilales bacterium]
MRKTKIIVTLGPATESPEMLKKLIIAGVNVFRLNMSHASHNWVRHIVPTIRNLSAELDKSTAILMDTQGPAIRTGDLPNKLDLKVGDSFTFTVRGHVSEEEHSVDTNYDELLSDINVGDVVLVDNGVIQMMVQEKRQQELVCKVMTSGSLGSRRHINLPGIRVKLPALTEKDLADVKVGVETGVDIIALSFVREGNDVDLLRQVLAAQGGGSIKIVAKIEDQSAVHNVSEIIREADCIMVARGDLGIEWPYEELPIVQRQIVKKCLAVGKPVIVATHMLESMIQNPLPTRAEITDVANAVFEQADAIMLSGETTVGKYPVKCVEVLDKVAARIERSGSIGFHSDLVLRDEHDRIASSAVHMANQLKSDALVVFTNTGYSARICAALRPRHTPIFAFTPDAQIARQLCMHYAVKPFVLKFSTSPLQNIDLAEDLLLQQQVLPKGAKLVVMTDQYHNGERYWSVQYRLLGQFQPLAYPPANSPSKF